MNRSLHSAFAAFLLTTIIAPAASAQWWAAGNSSPAPNGKKRPPVPPLRKDAFNTVNLTKAPELPYVPRWTGNQPAFLDGHFYPNLTPIEVYTVAWAYREPAGTVISWYRDALAAQGWQINNSLTRDTMLVARHTKEPLEIQFQVTPSAKPGFRCTAEVRWTKNPKYSKPKSNRR